MYCTVHEGTGGGETADTGTAVNIKEIAKTTVISNAEMKFRVGIINLDVVAHI
jgi:hypothetical protein